MRSIHKILNGVFKTCINQVLMAWGAVRDNGETRSTFTALILTKINRNETGTKEMFWSRRKGKESMMEQFPVAPKNI